MSYLVQPDPADPALSTIVIGVDQNGQRIETRVVTEKALTLYLNAQEIVTMMTIGDHPQELAIGYLLNQGMLKPDDEVTAVDVDTELDVVVVRTASPTNVEAKLKKKTQTSGCAQGTAFGDLMEVIEGMTLPQATLRTSWLYALTHVINTTPSLYLTAGAIHGCVLCRQDRALVYMEMSAATTPLTRLRAGSTAPARTRPTHCFTPQAALPPKWSSRPCAWAFPSLCRAPASPPGGWSWRARPG
jgi:FdhD protein